MLSCGQAIGLASLTGGSDECAWYFWNYLVDCTGKKLWHIRRRRRRAGRRGEGLIISLTSCA